MARSSVPVQADSGQRTADSVDAPRPGAVRAAPCEVVDNAPAAATGSSPRSTATGPIPAAGQFYMLAAEHGWGGDGERPFLPRAFSVAEATSGSGGVRLSFLLEDVGPGTDAPRRARRGRGAAADRPAWPAVLDAHVSSIPMPPGRSSSAAGSGSRRWRSGAGSLADQGIAERSLLGFRDREHSGGLELFRCSEVRLASEDGHAGHRGYVTDLLALMLEGRLGGDRGRLRLRPAGDARGGPGALRGARGRRRAGDGVADGVRLRRLLRLRDAAALRRLHAALRRRPGRPGGGRRDRARRGGRAPMMRSSSAGSISSTRSSTPPGPSTRSPPGGRSATR